MIQQQQQAYDTTTINRTQFVKIDEIESSIETITCGVLQGSTLGPLLFLRNINDLPNSSEKLSLRTFS